MVAAWPGMGHVGLNAAIYLLAKLHMTVLAEFEVGDLFDVDQVEVTDGIIQAGRRPRNRLFLWTDPHHLHDLVVFLGEAQPPLGKYAFCRQLIAHAKTIGVERVLTFAAMATQMHPENPSRLFAAATDRDSLEEVKRADLEVLENGQISGLNGVLLGAAVEAGMRGACLLGEMPHIFSQLPFPKASLAILEVFTTMAKIDLDLAELSEQARQMEEQLSELLAQMEKSYGQSLTSEDESASPDPAEPERLASDDARHIESLFVEAVKDRSKSFELKKELDRLGVFKDYEDRFLDLFTKRQ